MAVDNAHHARLAEAATATELRHFAQGAAFASKFATAEGLSKRELGEVAETFVAWKAADKALADYHAESAGAEVEADAASSLPAMLTMPSALVPTEYYIRQD
jgi:hypothetical protein